MKTRRRRGPRKLRFYNGRMLLDFDQDGNQILHGHGQFHVNICAYSQQDACNLLAEFGARMTLYEMRTYWFPCWGSAMDDVKPERGVWVEWEQGIPVRVEGKLGNWPSVQ